MTLEDRGIDLHYLPATEDDPPAIELRVSNRPPFTPTRSVELSADEADALVLQLRPLILRARQDRPRPPERSRYTE